MSKRTLGEVVEDSQTTSSKKIKPEQHDWYGLANPDILHLVFEYLDSDAKSQFSTLLTCKQLFHSRTSWDFCIGWKAL